MPTADQYWKNRDRCRQRNHEWYLTRKREKAATRRPAVMIIDPVCADPYWTTKTDYEQHRWSYHKGGRRVFIDGVEAVL
jgi:hypothetical protein